MVNKTAENFKVEEVSADKGYSGRESHDAIEKTGATAYIAFKKNATGGVGGAFQRMYHHFCLNRDEFLAHYHKRSTELYYVLAGEGVVLLDGAEEPVRALDIFCPVREEYR